MNEKRKSRSKESCLYFPNLNEQCTRDKHKSTYGKIHVRSSEHDHIHNDDNALCDGDHGSDIHDSHVRIPLRIPRDIRLRTPDHDHTPPLACDDGGGLARDDRLARDDGQVHDDAGVEDGDGGIPAADCIHGRGGDYPGGPGASDPCVRYQVRSSQFLILQFENESP